jgi:hypothetical protein
MLDVGVKGGTFHFYVEVLLIVLIYFLYLIFRYYKEKTLDKNKTLKEDPLHFTRFFTPNEQKKLFEGLINGGFLHKEADFNSFCCVFRLENYTDGEKSFKPLQWLKILSLFAYLLQQSGQNVIDEYLAELKAKKVFDDRKYYSRVKSDLNKTLATPKGQKSDLMQELETAIYDVAKYAR